MKGHAEPLKKHSAYISIGPYNACYSISCWPLTRIS